MARRSRATDRASREQLKQLLLEVLRGLPQELAKYELRPVAEPRASNPSGPALVLKTFASVEEAGRYFEKSFAHGDRSRRRFMIGPEMWEVVNAGIPLLRRVHFHPPSSGVQ